MGKINGNLTGTAPFGIVVRKVGETTGNRCTGSCNSFPVTFTTDPGDNQYYLVVTDAAGCVVDGRTIGGGQSNINCDVPQPTFNAVMHQPQCVNGVITQATLSLSNITNASRYKVWYCPNGWNNCTLDDCTNSTGFISGSSTTINLQYTSTDLSYILRLYYDGGCDNYKQYQDFIAVAPCAPVCNFTIQIRNPVC